MKVLLVIDMLKDFMEEGGALFCGEESRKIIPFVKDKIIEHRRSGGKVIYVCDAHAADDKEFKMFSDHAIKGTEGANIIEDIKPGNSDIVMEKTTVKPFYGTELKTALKEIAPDEIGVVGVCTSICIMEVVSDLRVRGYKTVVYEEGVADFDSEAHDHALKRMADVYGAEIR
ncbi:cysteine hydrolase family protein [Candidatus Omnitrophota bacterium]